MFLPFDAWKPDWCVQCIHIYTCTYIHLQCVYMLTCIMRHRSVALSPFLSDVVYTFNVRLGVSFTATD